MLAQVVHAFLSDRLGDAHRSALGSLYTHPDFANEAENDLRIAALVSFKGQNAINMLKLEPTPSHLEGLVWSSTLEWSSSAFSEEVLHSSRNCKDEPVWSAADAYRAGKPCPAYAKTFFELAETRPWRVDAPPTVWQRLPDGHELCVDGNARLHALVLDVKDRGWDAARHPKTRWLGS